MTVRRGKHAGRVSLMIKVCAQEGPFVERLVRHIVDQTDGARFEERYVVVDSRRDGFLRQFGRADRQALHRGLDELLQRKVIDRWSEPPTDPDSVRRLYRRWFACDSPTTHAASEVPVYSQLHGFDQARTEYLLQADVDVMIGRRDPDHDFFSDMAFALDADPHSLSVSFNIPHRHASYVPYSAPRGGFVPEVRFCLFDLRKLERALPLPNEVGPDGRLKLTWYRSLERKQKQSEWLSIRGGDGRTFFIHPMNPAKRDPERWLGIVGAVEEGRVPEVQYEQHDLVEDWGAWQACREDTYEHLIESPAKLHHAIGSRGPRDRTIVVVRHATKRSGLPETSGVDMDAVGLTAQGREEALRFARRLPESPQVFVTPELPRCHETARVMADAWDGRAAILVSSALLGAPFHQRGRWQDLKRRIGWSQLVDRWIRGQIDPETIEPYGEWVVRAVREILATAAPEGLTLVVTQGYVNSALCHHLTGRMEFRGGPLHGFIWPANRV